jgi:hypothetical protein
MRHEATADKGAPINGGAYFASYEQMQEPKHQAMQGVLRSLVTKKPKELVATVKAAQASGWDVSRMIIQDSVDSWFTLGSFLASRANLSYGKLMLAYLEIPGVDLSVQEGQTTSSFHRWVRYYNKKNVSTNQEAFDAVKHNVRQPISHIFLRQWAQYLPEKKASTRALKLHEARDERMYADRHEMAKKIFSKMTERNIDWTAIDEYGNTLCHVLVESESSKTLSSLLPWLKSLGVSMSSPNHEGFTPSDTAQLRLSRNASMSNHDSKDAHEFKEVIAVLERDLIADATAPSQSRRGPRRF